MGVINKMKEEKKLNSEVKENQSEIYNKKPLVERLKPFFLLGPGFLLTVGILVPFAMAIVLSFTNFSFRLPYTSFVGFDNWVKMFTSFDFWNGLLVTFEYAVLATGVEILLGLGIALLLSKENPVTKVLRVILLFPLMIAPVIATLIWQLMLNPSVGIVEKFLNIFGIYNFPWASSPRTALMTVIMVDAWIFTPFAILLLLAGLQSLPKSPYEAAELDGASKWFTFKTLTLPMLKPFLYIVLIFRLMDSIKIFDIIFAMTKGGPGNTLMNLSLVAYNKGFAFLNLGQATPYILILWVIVYIISNYLVKNWLKAQKASSGR